MKRLFFTVITVYFFIAATNAQDFGVKVGANFANVSVDGDELDPRSKFNLTLGVFAEFMLTGSIGIQPELIWSGQGFKSDGEDISSSPPITIELKQKLTYITLPVMANIYLGEIFFIQGGPYIAFLTKAKENISGSLGILGGDNQDDFKSTDVGAAVGLGVSASKIIFNLKYQFGLSDINDVADGIGKKNNLFNVNLGFRILDK